MITYDDAIELRIAFKRSLDDFLDEAHFRFEKSTGRKLSEADEYYYDSEIVDAISRITADIMEDTFNRGDTAEEEEEMQ